MKVLRIETEMTNKKRPRIAVLVLVAASLLPAVPARAEEVAFGLLNMKSIGRIVYYRNGEWVKPQDHHKASLRYAVMGPGDTHAEVGHYAKLIWGSSASVFRQWFPVNTPNSTVHLFKDAMACEQGSTLIVTNSEASSSPNAESWVATKTSGFVWQEFTGALEIVDKPHPRSLHVDGKKADQIPDLYRQLMEQIKSKWAAVESETVAGMWVEAGDEEKIKAMLRDSPYTILSVTRAPIPGRKMTLFYFRGAKGLRSPLFRGDDHAVGVNYRGWALLHPDQNITWPAIKVGVGTTYSKRGDYPYYRHIEPVSLVEIDKRTWLLTDAWNEVSEGGRDIEVYELVDGKFKSHGVFDANCG